MSTAKHSPLPWAIDDAGPNSGNVIRFEVRSGEDCVCEIECPSVEGLKEAPANAALIVKSVNLLPELVAALEDEILPHLENLGTMSQGPVMIVCELLKKARQ